MEYDFTEVDEMQRMEEVPRGNYLCRIDEVRERQTNDNHESWGLRLTVAEGPFKGKSAGWDNLVWSPRAISRVKKVLRLIGFPVTGKLKITPQELEGKTIYVMITPQVFRDPLTGTTTVRNRVPYDGYLEKGEVDGEESMDTPF